MNTLGPPDSFLVSAAEGWLELGNTAEANAELKQISAAAQNHPAVLNVRWEVGVAEQDWATALEAGRRLLEVAPEVRVGWLHYSYALRRAPGGGTQAAWNALLPALEKFPQSEIIPYNLACYACQLGQLDQARTLIQRAFAVGERDTIKQMALKDPDLEPLWDEIRRL